MVSTQLMWDVKFSMKMVIRLLIAVWQGITSTTGGNFRINFDTQEAVTYQVITFLIMVRF